MFFHGIHLKHLKLHYPVLSPRQSVGDKTKEQLSDRNHLMDTYGLEPVHLLEYWRGEYSLRDCLTSCFTFGDTVLAFPTIPLPFWQLSRYEVGVPVLDLRTVRWVFYREPNLRNSLHSLFPDKKLLFVQDSGLNLFL